jgi:hypothetical protein
MVIGSPYAGNRIYGYPYIYQPAKAATVNKRVGASLLAKAVGQARFAYQIHRFREQARSHKGIWMRQV